MPKRKNVFESLALMAFLTLTFASPPNVSAESVPSGDTAGALESQIRQDTERERDKSFPAGFDDQEGDEQFIIEEQPVIPPGAQIVSGREVEASRVSVKDRFMNFFSRMKNPLGSQGGDEADSVEDAEVPGKEEAMYQFGVEQIPLLPLPKDIFQPQAVGRMPEGIVFPEEPAVKPAQPARVLIPAKPSPAIAPKEPLPEPVKPAPVMTPVAPAPVAAPVAPAPQAAKPGPVVISAPPKAKISVPFKLVPKAEPEPAIPAPAAPTTVTQPAPGEEAEPGAEQIIPLPRFRGIYLISPLEQDMWDAARDREFEKAIQIRERIDALKRENTGIDRMIQLEQEMIRAARELDFERAINIREQIREIQIKIEVPEAPAVPEVKFRVGGFRIVGNETIPTEELLAYTRDLVNTDITLSMVREAALNIKKHYRELGYVAAYVYIAPQTLEDGILQLEVIEGKVGKVSIRGNRYFSKELLNNYFQIPANQPITFNMIQNQLSQLNKHEDIRAKVVFQPGEDPKTTDLILNVEDRYPLHASVDMNNYGTQLSGKERGGLTIRNNNVFGNMDELYARANISEGTTAYAVDYNTPFLDPNFRVGAAHSRGTLDLLGDFKALNAEGLATTYSVYGKTFLTYSPEFEASLRVGFDHKTIENRLLGFESGHDELRMINTVLDMQKTDDWGTLFWPNAFLFGVDAFGASTKNTEGLNRAQSGAPFFIYRTEMDRYVFLPNDMMFRARGSLQLTPDRMPSSEQFQIGGFNTVRGYPQGEYLGDEGGTISAELYVPPYFIPRNFKLPFQDKPLYDNMFITGFWDYGFAEIDEPFPGEAASKDLAGAGVGLRFRINEQLSANAHWGIPLTEDSSDGSNNAFYFGISSDLI